MSTSSIIACVFLISLFISVIAYEEFKPVDKKQMSYSIMKAKDNYYINRINGPKGDDYYRFTDTKGTAVYFTFDIREAEKIKTIAEAERLIKNNFDLIEDFSDKIETVKSFSYDSQVAEIMQGLRECIKSGDTDKEKKLLSRLKNLQN